MFFKEKQSSQVESDIPKQDEAILETTRNLKIGAIKPKIIFEYFYSHVDSQSRIDVSIIKESIPANLFITTSSQAKLDFDDHVAQVRISLKNPYRLLILVKELSQFSKSSNKRINNKEIIN